MNSVKICKSTISGKVSAIASKSDVHRLMICAALADEKTVIHNISLSEDILATADCLTSLGAQIKFENKTCTVTPIVRRSEKPELCCRESGSTLRFLLPVACALYDSAGFEGYGRLPERPMKELIYALKEAEVSFNKENLPFTTHGKMAAGDYKISGNVSSQYISGMLMALSIVPKRSTLTLTSDLESAAYVDMTLQTLKKFGAEIAFENNTYYINGREKLTSPKEVTADGDWSNAAFFLILGAIGEKITVDGLFPDSLQGDKEIVNILKEFGANVTCNESSVTVSKNELSGCKINLKNIPDMLPALAVVACFAKGKTEFYGGARLRLKESDRLKSVKAMIESLGGRVDEHEDGLTIYESRLIGGKVNSANDHRIVMAASIAASFCENETEIHDYLAVNKSYPDFFSDMKMLGGKVYGI